ncbi:MAG: hypothetical protein IKO06_06660, partial [Alphaproteobacteria bacterium]|nr:hypothetical protein [Alphaproteobacteria bacterium]
MIFKTFVAGATIPVLPEDFHGINTENYIAALSEDDEYVPDLAQTGGVMFELGRYFEKKYPGNEIFEEEYEDTLIDGLRQFFPDESDEKLRSHLSLLRASVRVYRAGAKVYDDYVSQKLAPQVVRRVRSEKDFDHENEFSYIKAPDGEFTKIYNFKKFLTYSLDDDERAAIRDYKKEASGEMSWLDKIDYIYKKIEWKKLPAYGISEKNPLLSDLGVGEWKEGKNIEARLLSPQTYTEGKDKIDVGVNLTTRMGYFVLANNLTSMLHKPLIDLAGSENVKSYKVLYPIPLQNSIKPFAHKYFGDFVIPLEIEPDDVNKDVKINANINLFSCNADLKCAEEKLDLSLDLARDGHEFLPNGFDNYYNLALQTVPAEASPEFSLNKAVVDLDDDGQALRLEFKTKEKVRNFKFFAEQTDGFAKFEAPLISVRDGIIYARLKLINDGNPVDLRSKKFIISAELNGKTSIRQIKTAHESSLFDAEQKTISLGIILLALIGGIILNYMPCVFPVLALKMMALSHTPPRKRMVLKQAIRHMISGIWLGFAVIIAVLCTAKYFGRSLGWGMQFQNIGFLVLMSFVIAAFIIILPYLNRLSIYKSAMNIPETSINYGIGFLTVMLATPCTGPYMATAVGFALSGSYSDLIIILCALALGLSLPYILILCLSKPEELFPKPGPWLGVIQLVMTLLLYLTLIWLALLIWRQTSLITISVLLLSVAVFMLCFRFYLRVFGYLSKIIDEEIKENTLKRAK